MAVPPRIPSDVLSLLGGAIAPPIVVAVSGGSDSVALTILLNDARGRGEAPPMHLAHLNHRIRAEEAERDAEFVRALAASLGCPVTVGECDVPAAARERRISLEWAARECRYEFLEKAAREAGARRVALGHTADDQVETVFHHILRGAGIHGLAGMPRTRPIAPGSDIRIIRPLLDCPRRDLMDFLASRGQSWRTDHTNLDTLYTRNRIRHVLIPALEESWPDIREETCAFAREFADLDSLLDSLACAWLDNHKQGCQEPFLAVRLDDLRALDEPLLSYVIRAVIARVLGDLRRIDEVHVRMVAELAATGSTGASLDLPRGLVVRRDYARLRFEKMAPGTFLGAVFAADSAVLGEKMTPGTFFPASAPAPAELHVPGSVRWGGWVIEAEVLDGERIWAELRGLCGGALDSELERPPEDPKERMRIFIERLRRIDPAGIEYLDFDRVGADKLVVRGRVPGDRFTPLGAPGQSKLKDFFIRRKVPHSERDTIPLVVAGPRVLVVAGLGVDDASALTKETTRILRVVCRRDR